MYKRWRVMTVPRLFVHLYPLYLSVSFLLGMASWDTYMYVLYVCDYATTYLRSHGCTVNYWCLTADGVIKSGMAGLQMLRDHNRATQTTCTQAAHQHGCVHLSYQAIYMLFIGRYVISSSGQVVGSNLSNLS